MFTTMQRFLAGAIAVAAPPDMGGATPTPPTPPPTSPPREVFALLLDGAVAGVYDSRQAARQAGRDADHESYVVRTWPIGADVRDIRGKRYRPRRDYY